MLIKTAFRQLAVLHHYLSATIQWFNNHTAYMYRESM